MQQHIGKLLSILLAGIIFTGCTKSENSNKDKAAQAEVQQTPATPSLPKANANTPLNQYVQITSGNQLMYMYYALQKAPVDYERMAQSFSREYESTQDGFKKQDILNKLKPGFDSEIAKIKNTRYVYFESPAELVPYNFAEKKFAIDGRGIRSDSANFFSDNSGVGYTFTNGWGAPDAFSAFKVADQEKARQIEGLKDKTTLQIYAYAQEADATDNRTTIKFQIVKLRLLDNKGNELYIQE